MTTLELLRAGRERVAKGWTRGAFARDHNGSPVCEDGPHAVCFCALGGIYAGDGPRYYAVEALRRAMVSDCGGLAPASIIANFNDAPETTQADVLALYDRAIAARDDAAPTPDGPRGCGS